MTSHKTGVMSHDWPWLQDDLLTHVDLHHNFTVSNPHNKHSQGRSMKMEKENKTPIGVLYREA